MQSKDTVYAKKSWERQEQARELADLLHPGDRLALAQYILVGLADGDEIGFENFASPTAVKRYVKQARNALKGLSIY